jgi:hypothetical protein
MSLLIRRAAGAACVLLLTAFAGCSSEPTRYPVSGTVSINGQPAALTMVKFLPTGGNAPATGGSGLTDDAGKFVIGEAGKNTGLLAGDYKVTFSQTLVNGKPARGGSGGKKSEALPNEKEGVPDAYRAEASTPVTATVGPKSTTFTFEIKR